MKSLKSAREGINSVRWRRFVEQESFKLGAREEVMNENDKNGVWTLEDKVIVKETDEEGADEVRQEVNSKDE